MFYGHLDKAPVNENDWKDFKPYEAQVKDDKLYGRGVSEGAVNFIATVLMLRDIAESKQ